MTSLLAWYRERGVRKVQLTATEEGGRIYKSLGFVYEPNAMRLIGPDDRETDRHEPPSREHGLAYEAAEFARLLRDGRTESDLLPLDETVAIMRVLDEVRRQLGVHFPGER
jgi:hypothetical protein